MKKKNGFTLIELLAVIVILAVIALIAVPRIIEILNKSRISAAEDSTMGIVEAAESYVANFMLQNQGALPSETLTFICNDSTCSLQNNLENYENNNLESLNFKGKKPTNGIITISDNGQKIKIANLQISGFNCSYDGENVSCFDNENIEQVKFGPTKEKPPTKQHEGVKAIVYLDPTDLTKKCDKNNINSDTGTKTGCMKWYAYAEDDSTYTMILDHDTRASVMWNSKGDNTDDSEIKAMLNEDAKEWNSIIVPRLISIDEVLKITGKENWENKMDNHFWFEDLSNSKDATTECAKSSTCKYAWLYDRTSHFCVDHNNGCLNNAVGFCGYSYWTSTPVADTNDTVWVVYEDGSNVYYNAGTQIKEASLRPVITIPKSIF